MTRKGGDRMYKMKEVCARTGLTEKPFGIM